MSVRALSLSSSPASKLARSVSRFRTLNAPRRWKSNESIADKGSSGGEVLVRSESEQARDLSERVIVRYEPESLRDFDYGNIGRAAVLGVGMSAIVAYAVNEYYRRTTGEGILGDKSNYEKLALMNHWGTKGALINPKQIFTPLDNEDVLDLVRTSAANRREIRAIGSALSPNYVFAPKDLLCNLYKMDKILEITDEEVTVQAGASLGQVNSKLREQGLMLRTMPSFEEASVGGVISTGSHGSFTQIGPIDKEVTGMTIVTSSKGIMKLGPGRQESAMKATKASLGTCGIITEVTLRCEKRYKVKEEIELVSVEKLRKQHSKWLKSSVALKYHWYPGKEKVVVVRHTKVSNKRKDMDPRNEQNALGDLRKLIGMTVDDKEQPTFSELRHALMSLPAPEPRRDWRSKVSDGEYEYWTRKRGLRRVGWADEVLKVEDGGPQFVRDHCVPVQRQDGSDGADIDFVEEVLNVIEEGKLHIDGPITQTFSCSSDALLSPAYDENPATRFSWVEWRLIAPLSAEEAHMAQGQMTKLQNETLRTREKFQGSESLSTCDGAYEPRSKRVMLFRRARDKLDGGHLFTHPFFIDLIQQYELKPVFSRNPEILEEHTVRILDDFRNVTEREKEIRKARRLDGNQFA